MYRWSNGEIETYLGRQLGCWLTHATDDAVRSRAASGGTTSQLLINMLGRGFIDGALVWRMRYGEENPRLEPFIGTTLEQVIAAAGSKYCSVRFAAEALPLIESFDGRVAAVTLPCDATMLRRRMAADPRLGAKVACIITLFCGHNSKPELTRLVVERQGLKWPEIAHLSYRGGHWRGRMRFGDAAGREVEAPYSRFGNLHNLFFFSERKCLACGDHFGFDSDVSVGDTWSRQARKYEQKPTMVVLRTDRGARAWEAALDGIEAQKVDPGAVLDGNCRGMYFHCDVTSRSRAGRRFGITIKDESRLESTGLDRFTAALCLFNYWVSRNERTRWLAELAPLPLVSAYVYAFKALQQASLIRRRPLPAEPRVSLIGGTLTGNRGAEAMLVTSIARLREEFAGARFVVHSYYPRRDRELCKDPDVDVVDATPLALLTRYLPCALLERALRLVGARLPRVVMPDGPRELRESRVMLDISGISFSDGRELFLPFNVLNALPAILMRVPLVKLSQGMGSFDNPLVAASAKCILRRCEKVFARGEETLGMLRDLGLGTRVDIAADIAFCFEDDDSLTVENPEYAEGLFSRLDELRARMDGGEGAGILALSVSAVVYKKCKLAGTDYPAVVAEVAGHYLDRGWAVLLLPNATREDSDELHNNDIPIIAEVRSHIGGHPREDALVAIDRDLNTASLREAISRADAVVASRFHTMVAALSLGIPVMVLGWGHKYREVLRQFGIEELAFDYRDLDAAGWHGRIDAFLERRQVLADVIRARAQKVRELSRVQFNWLNEFLADEIENEDPRPRGHTPTREPKE